MTTFQMDLIKIIVDKLLLGFVAALFGFYLSRLLEDHRSRNTYWLALLQQRIEASRNLVALLTEHHDHIGELFDTYETVTARHIAGKRPTKRDAQGGYNYVDYYPSFWQKVTPLVLLLSSDVVDALNFYLAESGKMPRAIKGDFDPVLATRESIDDAFVAVLATCTTAIATDPFHSSKKHEDNRNAA